MKFSTIIVFTLFYTTLASAQKSFQAQNADDAEKLTEQFKSLTPDSPCNDGENACVQGKFAQCTGGKFALNSCAAGLNCVVLPLVNKPGTSITCDTEADRQQRLNDARGAGKGGKGGKGGNGGEPQNPGNAKGKQNPGNAKGKQNPGNAKGKDAEPQNPGNAKGKQNPGNAKGKGAEPQNPGNAKGKGAEPQNPGNGKGNNGADPNSGNGKGKETKPQNGKGNDNTEPNPGNGKSTNLVAQPPQNSGNSTNNNGNNGNIAAVRKQNAKDAEALQAKFNSLTPNSSCTDNETACVDNKFAQCSNGKFALTACAQGTECAALPLVLKPGTTVACTTEADRKARLDAANKNQ